MAGRMDLEARLRALRASKAPMSLPAAPSISPPPSETSYIVPPPSAGYQMAPPPPAPAASYMVPPPVVVMAPPPPPPQMPVPESTAAPRKHRSFSRPRPNFAALSSPVTATPPATRPPTQLETQSSYHQAPPPVQQLPAIDMATVLGPAYEAVVAKAQYAIECERKRLVHTAINGYIDSGQALVALGRQQTVPHLQNILRTKALALLQRAEGLEAWARRVIAELHAKDRAAAALGVPIAVRSKEETLQAAIAQSQEQEDQALTEKEALVAKMKTQNNEMMKKLNQLVVLTKVKARFRRVISDRRARKAEEKRLRGESSDLGDDDDEDVDLARSQSTVDEDEDHQSQAVEKAASPPSSPPSSPLSSCSPREEQKRTLLNELHERIGLPQVDHLRTFKPLAETADSDRRREDLARELEEARLEAERMRAAVQKMEDTLQAAAVHSRERSIKLEKEKEDEVAQLQAELASMKSALEMERRSSSKRSLAYLDSDGEEDEEALRARDPDAYENRDIMDKLRASLQGLSHEDRETVSPRVHERRGSSSGRSNRIARSSEDHSSPRHRTNRMGSWGFDRDEEKFEEGELDDGLWV